MLSDLGIRQTTTVVLRKGPTFRGSDDSVRVIVKEIFEDLHYGAPPEGIVIDVGANIGVYSVFAASTAEQVHAFEPFPENITLLKANAAGAALLHKIKIHAEALTNHDKGADLYLSRKAGGHLLFSDNGREVLSDSIKVQTRTLAAFLDVELPKAKIAVIKVDCEGSEGSILTSLQRHHFERIMRWAIEYHDNVSSLSHSEIVSLLARNGYSVKVAEGKGNFGYIEALREGESPVEHQLNSSVPF